MSTSIRVYDTPEGIFERKMEWFSQPGNTTITSQHLRLVAADGSASPWRALSSFDCRPSGFHAAAGDDIIRTTAVRSISAR
jgi:hypothetical protein